MGATGQRWMLAPPRRLIAPLSFQRYMLLCFEFVLDFIDILDGRKFFTVLFLFFYLLAQVCYIISVIILVILFRQ